MSRCCTTKPTNWSMHTAKTQISLGMGPVWSESSLYAQWVVTTQAFFMWTAKTLIRLGRCQGWSKSLLGAQSFCWFCHAQAHMVDMQVKRFSMSQLEWCLIDQVPLNCTLTEFQEHWWQLMYMETLDIKFPRYWRIGKKYSADPIARGFGRLPDERSSLIMFRLY